MTISLIAKVEGIAEKIKAGILKGVSEVDGVILPDAEKLEPLVQAVLNAALPGSGEIAQVAESSLIALARLLDQGGAAAEKNLTDEGVDTALIASVKNLIPTIKAAAKAV